MDKMTDPEITRLCAEAMGYTEFRFHANCNPGYEYATVKERPDKWWPLRNDAQMVLLGKAHPEEFKAAVVAWASMIRCGEKPDLNRILCEKVAKS